MEKQFVTYEIALKLKDLGFNEECIGYYSLKKEINIYGHDTLLDTHCVDTIAPLWQQAIDWLRTEHNLHFAITWFNEENYQISILHIGANLYEGENIILPYEQAREVAILKALELLK